jgi:hypothetical protein
MMVLCFVPMLAAVRLRLRFYDFTHSCTLLCYERLKVSLIAIHSDQSI